MLILGRNTRLKIQVLGSSIYREVVILIWLFKLVCVTLNRDEVLLQVFTSNNTSDSNGIGRSNRFSSVFFYKKCNNTAGSIYSTLQVIDCA